MTKGRVGTNTDRLCKTKAAETWGLMLFLLDTLENNLGRLPLSAGRYARAGRHLEQMTRVFHAAGTRLTIMQIQAAWDHYKQYMALTDDIDDPDDMDQRLPKRHLVLHMLERLHDFGNPRFYANWMDETLNKTLKATCRAVSQITFEPALYVRMRELLKRIHAKSH